MSTGKRLAKRSILGTRVVAPGEDGRLYPGMIQAMKTEEVKSGKRYSVRFEGTRKVSEFSESEIIGPGFQNVSTSKLRPGQIVYITYCNREVQGSVICHRPTADQVIVKLLNGGPEVKKKLEEVRLLESRKSARLLSQGNTDFSKLADFNIVHERKRINSETSDVSGTSGRKRRGSESALSDSSSDDYFYSMMWGSMDESNRCYSPLVMSECTAAMVLMNLSCSPTALKLRAARAAASSAHQALQAAALIQMNGDISTYEHHHQSDSTSERLTSTNSIVDVAANVLVDGSVSPSSSGVSSLGSSWCTSHSNDASSNDTSSTSAVSDLSEEAEALLQLSHQESDEGIVSDQSSSADPDDATKRIKTEHVRIVYQCTWPGCGVQMDACSPIEKHIRKLHLGRSEPMCDADLDGEEEFYYTEIEVPLNNNNNNKVRPLPPALVTSQLLTTTGHGVPYLLPHPSEPSKTLTFEGTQVSIPNLADHMDMARPPHENPEYLVHVGYSNNSFNNSSSSINMNNSISIKLPPASVASEPFQQSLNPTQAAVPIAIPVTNFTFSPANSSPHILSTPPRAPFAQQTGGGKFIRLSPKPSFGSSPTKSPHRKPRGDAKKCRKVYGMEHREQWCTQCKWKKACTRFGEGS